MILRLVLLGLVLLPSLARADEPPDAIEEARDRYARGQEAFNGGRYEEALTAFEHAYATLQLPSLLADIAACQEKLGQDAAAAGTLRRYLKSDAVKDRPLVTARLHQLEARLHPEPPPPAPAPPSPSSSPSRVDDAGPLRPLRRAVIGTGVASAALALTAGALTLTAAMDYRDLANACHTRRAGCTLDSAHRLDRVDLSADVIWAIAGAAAVTTVVLHLVLRHERGKLRIATFALAP